MRFRGTFIAILLFSGLLAFIYFYEFKGEEKREAAREAAEKPLAFDREKVTAIAIERPGVEKVAAAKEGSAWKLTAPTATRGDTEKIDALLSALGWLKIERRLESVADAELESFGLKSPAATVAVTQAEAEAGKRDLVMKVGGASGVGGNRYVAVEGSPDVLMVSGSLESLLSADAASLRFRKVIGVNSWDLTRFSVRAGETEVALARNGESWTIEQPGGAGRLPADGTKVNALWSDIQSVDAEGFGPDHPPASELQRLGLAAPALTLTVEAKEQAGTLRVDFGRGPDGVQARRSDMETLLKVKPDLLEKLEKAATAPDDLRDPRVAPIDRWRLKELTLQRGATPVALYKDEESKWRWGKPDGKALDSESVNPLLDALEELKAVRYVVRSAAGAAGEITVSLREGEGETARTVTVTLLPGTDGADGARLLSTTAAPILYAVPQAAVNTLLERAAALKEPAEPAAAPAGAAPASPPAPEPPKP